jgi:PAS domain S-box-containing protein
MSDYSKKCTYFNKGWLDFTGHSLEEVIGDGWADDVHPDDLLVCVKTYEESFDKRQNFSMEYRLQRHDGEYRWVLDIGVPRYFANGEFAGYIGSCIDITDHKNLEEQILHSRKVDSIGRLAGGVAHDFNNKLTVILGYSQLSLMMITEENELWNNLIEIEKAAQLSQDITRQLLSFSRQEMVSPIVINLNLLISGSEKAISRIIGEDVTIFINLEENLWNVMIDPSQVDQILMNLSANARDAMPEGGKISISTSNIQLDDEFCRRHPTARQGEYVHLSFRDTGLGIDPVLLHKIFDPYFTTKDIGKGTGLGLATIHGIVSQNDGFISVASEPHTGTTFDIYFPRTELIDTNDSPTTNNINKHPGAILLVEDDRDVRKLAAIMLRELGYDVISAHSPDEAIDICRDNEIMINAILSDVIMPAMNGLEMMKRIEEIRPSLKVLFMSGYTSDILSPKGIVLDKINVVQKPLNMKTLAIKLRELMA